MNVVFLGAPGSGKGTQNKLITEQYNLVSVIAGDILRLEKKSGSPLGNEIASIIDKGNLVPDEMIDNLIENHLSKCAIDTIKTGYIFDGYPRTIKQGQNLDKIMEFHKTNIDVVFFLDVDEEVLIKRILERGKTSGREDDRNETIIRQRMKNYHEVTAPLKEYYKKKLVVLDGSQPIEDVNKKVRDTFMEIVKIKKGSL